MNRQFSSSKLAAIFGLDFRSLAIFRIGLAIIVIIDLTSRAQALNAHYTDAGVLPRQILTTEFLHPWYWSLHLISGHFLFQSLLFLSALLITLAMLFGYHTQLATMATWALNVSLQNRNPALIFAGDDVLRAVLFWAMFLPLGTCYSIDSGLNSLSKPVSKQALSGATVAFIVQLCFVYIWSAAFKTQSPIWWPDGDAVYYSLSFDQYVTGFGQFLLDLPPPFLRLLTYSSLGFEWLGPLMLFIPFRTSFFRCVTIISFILLHTGFELCFSIGILSYLSIVNWLALTPSSVWDAAAKHLDTLQRRDFTIYYAADRSSSKKVLHLIQTFFILPKTSLLPAQDNDLIYADTLGRYSWAVVDWQGNRYHKYRAIAYVCRQSPIFCRLAPLLEWHPVMAVGTKLYNIITSNHKITNLLTKPFRFRPLKIKPSLPLNIIAWLLLFLTFHWNFKGFITQTLNRRPLLKDDWVSLTHDFLNKRTFQRIDVISYLTRLDQSWSIFAPAPPRDDGWHVISGKLKDGTEVNLLQEDNLVSWEKPSPSERQKLYSTIQWRVYFINLNRSLGKELYPHYGAYLCRHWNRKHKGEKELKDFEIFFMDERTVPPNSTQSVEKTIHWQQSCLDQANHE